MNPVVHRYRSFIAEVSAWERGGVLSNSFLERGFNDGKTRVNGERFTHGPFFSARSVLSHGPLLTKRSEVKVTTVRVIKCFSSESS